MCVLACVRACVCVRVRACERARACICVCVRVCINSVWEVLSFMTTMSSNSYPPTAAGICHANPRHQHSDGNEVSVLDEPIKAALLPFMLPALRTPCVEGEVGAGGECRGPV